MENLKIKKPITEEYQKIYSKWADWCNENSYMIMDDNPEYYYCKKFDISMIDMTQEKIFELKQQLASLDYKTNKFIEGELTDEEWTEVKRQRKELRDEINRLEGEL
jgi:hypothetical protein